MKILDTLSGTEKEIDISKKVRIYLCGMTVYDEAHIGHARTIIVFDVLRRFLESQGAKVEFIQNFTDVDDKIINRAKMENMTAFDISTRYIDEYFDEFDKLNVKRATEYPKATEHIEHMINLIQNLVDKKIAYVTKNGVYFAITKFSDYGKLSKKKIDELISGSRIQVDEEKNNPLDFALWKFSDEEPSWDSPWGKGRPGWHIECSAMSIKYLGANFEIHGGGRDLIFPHHENEIAQSESFTQKPFAQTWMHVGMITINGEKMSKSIGNIKSVKHVLENFGPNTIRLFCLSGRYSKPIDYSEDILKENIIKWRQVESCYYEMVNWKKTKEPNPEYVEFYRNDFADYDNSFTYALKHNLNTRGALSEFFALVDKINVVAADEKLDECIDIVDAGNKLNKMLDILGLKIQKISDEDVKSINQSMEERELLREQKKFQEADKIRDQISQMGVELIDHQNSTTWIKRENIKSE